MQLKLTEMDDLELSVGKVILYVIREDFKVIREGSILGYAEDYALVKIGQGRYIEAYSWEYSADITLLSILGDRK